MDAREYFKCECGALSVVDEYGDTYSCLISNRKKFFPGLDLRKLERLQTTCTCDYCVNHYGLDLCGCGSGELFGQCDNGLEECKKPMQKLGQYTNVRAADAWF